MWIIVRLLIGIAILVIVEIYFLRKADFAVKTLFSSFYKNKYKIVKRVFICWINLYPLVLIFVYIYFAITSTYISAPDNFLYNYLLVYPFWVLFVLMTQVSVFLLIIDVIKVFFFPFYRKHKTIILIPQSIVIILLVSFFLLYIPLRIIYDYNSVSVRNISFSRELLPDVLNDFKIVFISDVQADRYTDANRLRNFVKQINEIEPDLVLIAGDLITTGPDFIELSGNEIGKIKSKYGVYSCIGDHDNWAYRNNNIRSILEVRSSMEKNNVDLIDNKRKAIPVGNATIEITFITNTYVSRVPESVLDSLSSNGNGDLKIFLTHQPREFLIEAAFENDFDLFLAGHTHGGQLTLLFPFIDLTPTLIETNYIRGDFWFNKAKSESRSDDMLMIVTRGLGMSIAPIRYNSTPEVTVITLKSNPARIFDNK